jgi:hypothetical protein
MRSGVFNAEVGFRFDDARAVPRAVIPARYPRSNKFPRGCGSIFPEKTPWILFQTKRIGIKS